MRAAADEGAIAAALLQALDQASLVDRPRAADPSFGVDAAYAVADQTMRRRLARGERRVGWKIGFTNRGIWERYGVHAPIWGPVWNTTVEWLDADRLEASVSLVKLSQPRIEPEIMFGFARAPEAGMDEAGVAACIDWVAHGFEIVQTHFDGWKFELPDTVADFALHGRLFVGRRVPLSLFADPVSELAAISVELIEGERVIDHGHSSVVLGGPLSALRIWVDAMAAREPRWPIAAGDIVSTGTITDAAPMAASEQWQTRLSDGRLPGLRLRTEG